jgi:hypothetical protein
MAITKTETKIGAFYTTPTKQAEPVEPVIGDFSIQRVELTMYKVTLMINESHKELNKVNDLYECLAQNQIVTTKNDNESIVFTASKERVDCVIAQLYEYKLLHPDVYEIFVHELNNLSLLK